MTRLIVPCAMLALAACAPDPDSSSPPSAESAPVATEAAPALDADIRPPDLDAPQPTPALAPELVEAVRLIQVEQFDDARLRAAAYSRAHPDAGQGEFVSGLAWHREKRYAQAREHFDEAIRRTPDYHPAHHFRGWASYYLGDMDTAREAFTAHLRAMATEGDSWFGLALVAIEQDRLEDAQAHLEHAIELVAVNPARESDLAKYHARLGDVHLARDDLASARYALEKSLELGPQASVIATLARVYRRLGEEERAAELEALIE